MARIALALVLLLTAAAPAAAHTKADLEAQLKRLMEWWPGDYDNNEQIVRQSGGGLEATVSAPFYRIHTVYKRVEIPALGPNVLSVREWKNNNPSEPGRTRLYSLSVDEKAGAIRVAVHLPRDEKASLPADDAALAPFMRPARDGCELYFNWVGGQFQGGFKERACTVENGREWFQYELVVGEKYTWWRDRRLASRGGKVTWENAPGTNFQWFEQTKARWLTCEVQENADGDMRKTKKLTDIRVHDQGGEADIAWPDGRTLTFLIHSRAFTSPPERTYPLFRIHDKNNMQVPFAYAYAVDDSERYGLNLGWFYIRCVVEKK